MDTKFYSGLKHNLISCLNTEPVLDHCRTMQVDFHSKQCACSNVTDPALFCYKMLKITPVELALFNSNIHFNMNCKQYENPHFLFYFNSHDNK